MLLMVVEVKYDLRILHTMFPIIDNFYILHILPVRLGWDCGLDWCDIVRLRGRSSELGLNEPGVSVFLCRSDVRSSLVERGLGAELD